MQSPDGNRHYRLTPASLAAARNNGWTVQVMESWFMQRTGQTLPPAARLLLTGAEQPPVTLERHLVLHVATTELADGLMQWPATRVLIQSRLGPTALVVAEDNMARLRERLQDLGIRVESSA